MPFGAYLDPQTGLLVVSDCDRIILIDPNTGAQRPLIDNLGSSYGLTGDSRGYVYVATIQGLVKINLLTGRAERVFNGGKLTCVIGVTVVQNGDLCVLNMGFLIHQAQPSVVDERGGFDSPTAVAS